MLTLDSENLKGTDHFGDLGVYERIILKWISRNWVWISGLNSCGLGLASYFVLGRWRNCIKGTSWFIELQVKGKVIHVLN